MTTSKKVVVDVDVSTDTTTEDTSDEDNIIDPASILLADYIAANRREEALYEKIKVFLLDPEEVDEVDQGLALIRAANRELEVILKQTAVTLFHPLAKPTTESTKVIYQIYAKERRGKDKIVDSEGKVDREKFHR